MYNVTFDYYFGHTKRGGKGVIAKSFFFFYVSNRINANLIVQKRYIVSCHAMSFTCQSFYAGAIVENYQAKS